MKNKNWNFLVYVHAILLLWALLFVISLSVPGGGEIAQTLAFGTLLCLFVNIPLSIFTLILRAKDLFDIDYEDPAKVLSIINLVIGIIAWYFVVLLLQKFR